MNPPLLVPVLMNNGSAAVHMFAPGQMDYVFILNEMLMKRLNPDLGPLGDHNTDPD